MSDLFGTYADGQMLSTRQRVAMTMLIVIAIIAIILWWIRTRPKDIVFLGPANVGPHQRLDPDQQWKQLMTADQIAKSTSNNVTCSFFVYVNAASLQKVPVNYDGSYKFKYLMTVGNTLGVIMDPTKQQCTVDILQSAPQAPRNNTIAFKAGLGDVLRTLEVKNVLISRWNQITLCVEGRSIDVFLNGKLATSAILDNVPLRMFSGILLNGSPDFEGQVCMFQFWTHRRTSQQILENYRKQTDERGKPLVPDPELTWSGAWERFWKASCETTGICGFPVKVGPMEYVEYEFA